MKSNPMTANMTDAQLDQQLDALNNIDEETLKLWLGRAQKVAKFFSPAATAFSRANKALGGRLPKILGVAALARRRRAKTETAFEMASCAGFVRRLAFVRSVERRGTRAGGRRVLRPAVDGPDRRLLQGGGGDRGGGDGHSFLDRRRGRGGRRGRGQRGRGRRVRGGGVREQEQDRPGDVMNSTETPRPQHPLCLRSSTVAARSAVRSRGPRRSASVRGPRRAKETKY